MTWIPELRLDAINRSLYNPRPNSTGAQMELLGHIDATAEDLVKLVRYGNTSEIRAGAVERLVHKLPTV